MKFTPELDKELEDASEGIFCISDMRKLYLLGEKLKALDVARDNLMREARRITGFDDDDNVYIDPTEELEEAMENIDGNLSWAFVNYAVIEQKRSRRDALMSEFKNRLKELGGNPSSIDWKTVD